MQLYPGRETDYERRHNPIPDDLSQTLKDHGVRNYSIFLHEQTGRLFGYAEVESEAQWAEIASTESCRRWWKFMEDIMETNPDSSPRSEALREVFYLA